MTPPDHQPRVFRLPGPCLLREPACQDCLGDVVLEGWGQHVCIPSSHCKAGVPVRPVSVCVCAETLHLAQQKVATEVRHR
ncbi:hypothetical protein E2C01_038530 [Portunus trituberculatus]|uniref:Uncharacterized protein n=1 Tax=Portunus trituberculatus TaxID=210409 RepID=A0A5B7FI63_PORTR|nr:hypothetical protein [Portunus trituberculatus]